MARDLSNLNRENEVLVKKLEWAERKAGTNTNTTGGSAEL